MVSLKHLERTDSENDKNSSNYEVFSLKKRKCNLSSSFWENNGSIKDVERWESTDSYLDDQSAGQSSSASPVRESTDNYNKPKLMSLKKTKSMLMQRQAFRGSDILLRHPSLLDIPRKNSKSVNVDTNAASKESKLASTSIEECSADDEQDAMEEPEPAEEKPQQLLETEKQEALAAKRSVFSPELSKTYSFMNLLQRRESNLEYIVGSNQLSSPPPFSGYKDYHIRHYDTDDEEEDKDSNGAKVAKVLESEIEKCCDEKEVDEQKTEEADCSESTALVHCPKQQPRSTLLETMYNAQSAEEIILSFHEIFSELQRRQEVLDSEQGGVETGATLLLATLCAVIRVCDGDIPASKTEDSRATKRELLDHESFLLMVSYLLSLNKYDGNSETKEASKDIASSLFLAIIAICRRGKSIDFDSMDDEDSWLSFRSFAVDDYAIAKLGDLHFHDIVVSHLKAHSESAEVSEGDLRFFEHGLCAIRYLSVNVDNAIKMVSCDSLNQSAAAEVCTSLLKKFGTKSAIIARNGLNFLCNLCCDAESISLLGSFEACEVSLETLRFYCQHHLLPRAETAEVKRTYGSTSSFVPVDSVMEAALEAVAILACRSTNNARLGAGGACELCVSLLSHYCAEGALADKGTGHRSRIIINGLSALINLSCDSDNNTKLGVAGACQLCVTFLTAMCVSSSVSPVDPSRELITGKILFAMRNLASDHENNVKFASLFCCEAVIQAIKFQLALQNSSFTDSIASSINVSSVHVWQQAFCAIRTLSRFSENNFKLGTPTACDVYVGVLNFCLSSIVDSTNSNSSALVIAAAGDKYPSTVEIYTLIYEIFFALHSITRASSVCKGFGAGDATSLSICDAIIAVMTCILSFGRTTDCSNSGRLSLRLASQQQHSRVNSDDNLILSSVIDAAFNSLITQNNNNPSISAGLDSTTAAKIIEQGMLIMRNVLINNEDFLQKDSTKENLCLCCVTALQIYGHNHAGIAKRGLHIISLLSAYCESSSNNGTFDYLSTFGALGACEIAVQLLKIYYCNALMINGANADSALGVNGLIAMRYLAGKTANRDSLLRAGAIEVCLHLQSMFQDMTVAVEASHLLQRISEGFDAGKISARDFDIIAQSVSGLLVNYGPGNDDITKNGLKALLNLIYSCDKQKINDLLQSCMDAGNK